MFPHHKIQKDLLSISYFDREQGFCQIGEGSSWDSCKTQFKGGGIQSRYRPRFFDQVGDQTTNASIGNKYFFKK